MQLTTNWIVTHFFKRQPKRTGWVELQFVTKSKEAAVPTYYHGLSEESFTREEIERLERKGSIQRIEQERAISKDQSVWLAEDRAVYLANADNPRTSASQIAFEDLGKWNFDADFLSAIGVTAERIMEDIPWKSLQSELMRSLQKLQERWYANERQTLDYLKQQCMYAILSYDEASALQSSKEDPDIDENILTPMSRFVADHSLKDSSIQKFQVDQDVKPFDILDEQDLLFKTAPFLLLSPYFLTHERKEDFGVIPFARQISYCVGILQDNKINVQEDKDFLLQVIEQTVVKNNARIYTFKGYIFDKIAAALIEKKSEDKTLRQRFLLQRKFISTTDKLTIQRMFKDKGEFSHKDIILFDPMLRYKIQETFKRIHVSTIRHDLDIPVGLGFSHYAVPHLFGLVSHEEKGMEPLWKTIYNDIMTSLSSAKTRIPTECGLEPIPEFEESFPFVHEEK